MKDMPRHIEGYPLRPEQSIVEIQEVELTYPEKHISVIDSIKKLTAAKHLGEVGLNGPPKAAGVTEANKQVSELGLYQAFFPRDAHIVSAFLEMQFPELAKATIAETLKYTGVKENLHTQGLNDEQELWKSPHEVRDGENDERAKKHSREKNWGWPYYGAIDTTTKNAKAIARVALSEGLEFLNSNFTARDGNTYTYDQALEGHLNWIRKRMNFNPEGLVESLWLNPKHHPNQAWTDSPDGFHHKDGTWAEHHPEKNWGVASLEVQAEVYDALICARDVRMAQFINARYNEREKLIEEITDLSQRSEKLRRAIFDHFWVEDGQYFARGTDRDKDGNLRPLEIKSSDMGHLLNSHILDGDDPETSKKREATIRHIFSPEMLSINGVRTLSTDSERYWEDSYHNGTSWPWVTYYIALGLERHKYFGLANELKRRAFSVYEETKILPEYASGSNDPAKRLIKSKAVIEDPTLDYGKTSHQVSQPPQEIQAWTLAAILAIKYENGKRIFGKLDKPQKATDPDKQKLEEELLANLP